jgi:hypothetical protein
MRAIIRLDSSRLIICFGPSFRFQGAGGNYGTIKIQFVPKTIQVRMTNVVLYSGGEFSISSGITRSSIGQADCGFDIAGLILLILQIFDCM